MDAGCGWVGLFFREGYWVCIRKTLVLWFLFSLYIIFIMTWAIDEKPWTRHGEESTRAPLDS